MKKILYFTLAAALSAATLVSCNKIIEDEINNDDPQVVDPEVDQPAAPVVETLTFAIQGDEATKAILSDGSNKHCVWEDGDVIGSIVTDGTAGSSTVDASTTPVKFSVTNAGGFVAGKKIYAWFPYSKKETDPEIVAMSIPSEQYMNGSVFDFSTMPMASKGITITEEMIREPVDNKTTVDEIAFYNLASLIDFKIFASSSYTTERVLSVTFNASGNIAGNFSKNLTVIDPAVESTLNISGYTETSVTTNVVPFSTPGADKEHALDVYMVVAPGTHSGSIVVVTDAATYTWSLPSRDFQRSHVRSFGLQLDKASGVTRVAHPDKGNFSWDLSRASYDNGITSSLATWSHGILTMTNTRNGGTAVNNWIPPTKDETRFYTNNILSFTPGSIQIEKVEFTASSTTNANNLAAENWTNATATVDGTLVTIVPTDGSSAFSATLTKQTGGTKVKVYYDNTNYSITKGSEVNGTFSVSSATAKVNSTVTLSATPDSGYALSAWSVTDSESNPVPVDGDSFIMPASNVTVNATFTLGGYAINITTPSNGTVSTSPAGAATAGTVITITATPGPGYYLGALSVVGTSDSSVIEVTNNQFTMPDKAVTVTATFARVYTVVFNSTTNQSGTNKYVDNSFDTVSDGITVTCCGISNNNNGWDYIKAGKARTDSDPNPLVTTGTIATKYAISNAIKKVEVTMSKEVASASATAKLYVASDSAFTSIIETINLGTVTDSNGIKVFSITIPADNRFYKLEFECSNPTKNNGVISITQVQYFQDPT